MSWRAWLAAVVVSVLLGACVVAVATWWVDDNPLKGDPVCQSIDPPPGCRR